MEARLYCRNQWILLERNNFSNLFLQKVFILFRFLLVFFIYFYSLSFEDFYNVCPSSNGFTNFNDLVNFSFFHHLSFDDSSFGLTCYLFVSYPFTFYFFFYYYFDFFFFFRWLLFPFSFFLYFDFLLCVSNRVFVFYFNIFLFFIFAVHLDNIYWLLFRWIVDI